MAYLELEFRTDSQELLDLAVDVMQRHHPGWQPVPSGIATWIMEAVVEGVAVPIAEQANTVPDQIFHSWLEDMYAIPAKPGASAQLTTTWVFRDTAGYTVPAGTILSLVNPAGEPIQFQTVDAVVAPAGVDTVVAAIYATDPGAEANGITPAPGDVQLAEPMEVVTSVTGNGVTSGGADPETEQEYLDRGRRRLQTIGGGLVLPQDFAILATDVPGVTRAVAINGFIPPSSTGQERAVAVAVHGPDGLPVSTAVKTAVDQLLQARREVNFIVNVIDPTYTTVDVTATATAYDGYATAEVQALAAAAVEEFLDPAGWGTGPEGEVDGTWLNRTKVRYFDLVHVLEGVIGLDHVDTLQVNGGTSDVTLTGVAPLPQVGTISITVATP